MWPKSKFVIILTLLTGIIAEEVKSDRSDLKKSLTTDCIKAYSSTCLKLDIVSWIDKLNEEDNFNIFPGITVVRENGSARSNTADIVAELARNFPNNPDARLDAFLVKKIASYFSSHSLKFNIWGSANDVEARGGGGGGGGGKGGKGGFLHILAAAAMMKSTLAAIALGAIAAIAKKALMTALISLLISAIIGLKSLFHHEHKSTTYEVISKPIYTHANTHSMSHEEHGGHYGHSSYGRSLDVPLPLGLQEGYKPPQ